MQTLKMDFQSQSAPPVVPVMQSDSQSRFIGITLYDGGVAYKAPTGAVYTVEYHGPGANNTGWYDTIQLSSGTRRAVTVDSSNPNIVTLELAEQALRVNGEVEVSLCVVNNTGYKLNTFPIICRVTGAPYVDPTSVRSYFYVTGLTSEQWLAYVTACQDAQKRAEDAAAKLVIDDTLTQEGRAADARATGRGLSRIAIACTAPKLDVTFEKTSDTTVTFNVDVGNVANTWFWNEHKYVAASNLNTSTTYTFDPDTFNGATIGLYWNSSETKLEAHAITDVIPANAILIWAGFFSKRWNLEYVVFDAKTMALSNVGSNGRVRSMQNIMKNWYLNGGYANQNGNLVASDTWRVAHMVPVSGGAILVDGQFGYMSGRDDYNNVVCYDMDRKYLGGCFRAENEKVYDNYVVTLLPNTRFISVTTSAKLLSKLSVYLYDNMLPLRLLSNYATGWQWMNGSVDIKFTASKVTVTFPEGKNVYICRRTNGTQYDQTKLGASNSVSVDFTTKQWWAVYYDGMEVSADEAGEKTEVPVIKVANTDGNWGNLFTRNRFVFAVLYDGNVVYAAPSNNGTVINSIDYGNPAKIAYNAVTQHKYRSAKMFLSTGQLTIDTVNRTIQVTKRTLAVVDNGAYYWIPAAEEPVPMLDSEEAEKHHMLILAYDSSKGEINLYNTAQFRALGAFGYYIAAWYENYFWYPHMGSSFSIVLNGTEYKAGALFDEERRDSYIEKKYANQFQQIRSDLAGRDSRHMYLASGGITIDQNAGTIQVSSKCLGVPDTFHYQWITASDPVEMAFNTAGSYGMPMRILAYDASTQTINLYDTSLFRKLGTNGFYIASWYLSKLYNPHINPDVTFIVNGKEYKAGDLFADNEASFIPKRITDYVQKAVSGNVEDDIVTPSHWDCMEGRQLSIFYDCLSRHDGKENLYVFARGTNAPTLTRNEYCMNYTPTAESSDFSLTVRRLNEDDCHIVSSKAVQVKVHHKLKNKLTKNVCICGDSLVDNGHVATEVYRLLAEDGDCVIHQLGTRGPDGGKHEGRGSWTFARYLADSDYAGKTNAFWDKLKSRLDFQKYCETNGYEGIDYFLIALGTNDVSQGSTLYRTEAEVQKFVDQAKQFIDALLDKETGFPNCKVGIGLCGPGSDYSYQCGASMGIFHMSINTLNLALIKAFDAGKYHKNVTCFAHGLRTDRRLAFPYTDKPVTNRFTETSRTLTNSIHPSARGYQAWADGYYCQIRAWLTEDSE